MSDPPATSPPSLAETLALYKIAVDTAERTSDRRQAANAFYLTFASGLLAAFFGSYASEGIPAMARLITCLLGIGICVAWFLSLARFRQHNGAKFKAIAELEQYLAFRFFEREEHHSAENSIKWRFTTIEFGFPGALLAAFAALLIISLTSLKAEAGGSESPAPPAAASPPPSRPPPPPSPAAAP